MIKDATYFVFQPRDLTDNGRVEWEETRTRTRLTSNILGKAPAQSEAHIAGAEWLALPAGVLALLENPPGGLPTVSRAVRAPALRSCDGASPGRTADGQW